MEQIGDIAKVLALGAMPWLNYLKPLRWHLKSSSFNPVPIFNAVATICAALVSAYFYYGSPDPEEMFFPLFRVLLPLFIFSALAYFGLFLAYRDSVAAGARKWPLAVAFTVYILLFLSFAFISVNLEIRRKYHIVSGQVVDRQGKGISDAEVAIYLLDDSVGGCSTKGDGSFFVAVEKEKEIDRIKVNKDGFKPYLEILTETLKTRYRIPLQAE